MITHVTTLLELWQRRQEPENHDLLRAVAVAKALEADPASPPALLALAHRLVVDVHKAAGWSVPAGLSLPRCAGAAASIRHACMQLVDDVLSELRRVEAPVMLTGALGASQSAFGCWDALPAQGEVLVRLGDRHSEPCTSMSLGQRGVRWAGVGELGDLLEWGARSATLGEREVLVPNPEVYVARVNGLPSDPGDVGCLVYCAAARATAVAGQWARAIGLAHVLGNGRAPVETAMRLGLTDWLGLSVGPITRLSVALRGLLTSRRAATLL